MAEVPDYLIYHDEKINSFIDQEINVTIQVVRCPSILICMWLSFFIVSVY
jgi:hypothetical protein